MARSEGSGVMKSQLQVMSEALEILIPLVELLGTITHC